MSDEAAEFRAALVAAGQPWSRWGVRVTGVGVVALLAVQLIPNLQYPLEALFAAVGVIAVGWVMLIVAVVRRRRWYREHPIADVPLVTPEAP